MKKTALACIFTGLTTLGLGGFVGYDYSETKQTLEDSLETCITEQINNIPLHEIFLIAASPEYKTHVENKMKPLITSCTKEEFKKNNKSYIFKYSNDDIQNLKIKDFKIKI